jgi:hypothetical protein
VKPATRKRLLKVAAYLDATATRIRRYCDAKRPKRGPRKAKGVVT